MPEGQPRDEGGRFSSNPDSSDQSTTNDDASSINSDGVTIKFDAIKDEETRQAVRELLERDKANASQLDEVTKTLDRMEKREQQKQYEEQRNKKMEELRTLDPQLADKHKDESDLEKIDLLIETARDFNKTRSKQSFPEWQSNSPDEYKGSIDPKKVPYQFDLASGQIVPTAKRAAGSEDATTQT